MFRAHPLTILRKKNQRWIKEVIEIHKRGPRSMNRDEGVYTLSHTWDAVLENATDSRRRNFPLLSGKHQKKSQQPI